MGPWNCGGGDPLASNSDGFAGVGGGRESVIIANGPIGCPPTKKSPNDRAATEEVVAG